MTQLEDFMERLKAQTQKVGWEVQLRSEMTRERFRGRLDDSGVPLPKPCIGAILGPYPVLVCEFDATGEQQTRSQLRSLHNQAAIARSYLTATQVVDLHVLMVCDPTNAPDGWKKEIDILERDEAVCRKLVWARDKPLQKSFELFTERTFLSRVWDTDVKQSQAPLDRNAMLVQDILVRNGLSAETASRWIDAATRPDDDPVKFVHKLVGLMGGSNDGQ